MKQTKLSQCEQKPNNEQPDCIFDLLPDAQSNLLTPSFKDEKQKKTHESNSKSVIFIEPTDKYGFKSQKELKKINDRKTLNARMEKWRVMINNYQQQNKDLVKQRTRKGIPDGVRQLAWPLLAGVPHGKAEAVAKVNCGNYKGFLQKTEFKFEHQIRLDVHRTFPDNINFQDQTVLSESLVDVLKALSEAVPDMGYCQGLNFLTAALIMVTNDENAFWILYRLMTKYNLAEKYQNPNSLYREFYILESFIAQYQPITYKIIKNHNIDLFYFTTEWFITMFSATLPIDLFYRVFEIFLIEGEKTLFRCALAILHFKEQKLVQLNEFESGLRHLKAIEDLQTIDLDTFINVMLTKYKFSKNVIKQLNDKYYKTKQK